MYKETSSFQTEEPGKHQVRLNQSKTAAWQGDIWGIGCYQWAPVGSVRPNPMVMSAGIHSVFHNWLHLIPAGFLKNWSTFVHLPHPGFFGVRCSYGVTFTASCIAR